MPSGRISYFINVSLIPPVSFMILLASSPPPAALLYYEGLTIAFWYWSSTLRINSTLFFTNWI